MARIEGHVTWLCVVVAMVVCFGGGTEAGRSLLQAVSLPAFFYEFSTANAVGLNLHN